MAAYIDAVNIPACQQIAEIDISMGNMIGIGKLVRPSFVVAKNGSHPRTSYLRCVGRWRLLANGYAGKLFGNMAGAE
jgi:hypothetical protein